MQFVEWVRPVVTALVVLSATFATTPVLIRLLHHRDVIDRPNHRSSHEQVTVRGAGLGLAMAGGLTTAFASSSLGLWIVVPASLMALVGFLDDVSELTVAVRLPAQVVAAVSVSVGAVLVLDAPAVWLWLGPLWIVGYLNAFNFMDGINGISGVHAAIVGATWTVVAVRAQDPETVLLGLVLAAGAVGFLPYNFPVARAFLGDAGSYFLGTWIAVGVLLLSVRIGFLPAVLPTIVYVVDTSWTLVRRLRSGRRWNEPHRDHVYQQLVRGGWSHARATGTIGVVTAVTGALAVWASTVATLPSQIAVTAVAVVPVGAYLAMPYLVFDTAPGLEPQDTLS